MFNSQSLGGLCSIDAVMAFRPGVGVMAVVALCLSVTMAMADSVRLTNGDVVRGEVVSLDKDHLLLRSENFGEMEIPRNKVALIGMGDQPVQPTLVPTVPLGQGTAEGTSADAMPSMQNPQVRQQIDRLLEQTLGGKGIGNIGNMQTDLKETSRGLKDLQKDLGPGPGADALDGYIKLFELFGGATSATEEAQSPQ